jgi:hypothetical protein
VPSRTRDLLAEQYRASIAQSGEIAELMPGIGLRDWPRFLGQRVAGKDPATAGVSSVVPSRPSSSARARLTMIRRGVSFRD